MAVVEGEEEDGEEDGHVLVGGTAVGGTEQLQARHCDHQSAYPGGRGGNVGQCQREIQMCSKLF